MICFTYNIIRLENLPKTPPARGEEIEGWCKKQKYFKFHEGPKKIVGGVGGPLGSELYRKTDFQRKNQFSNFDEILMPIDRAQKVE